MLQRITLFTCFMVVCLLSAMQSEAQVPKDTTPVSIDPVLEELAKSTVPHEYVIAGITVSGTKYLDQQLLISISGLTVGDKVMIPGGDNFSKAILNLWKQNLFANIRILITKIEGDNIWIEISVSERPRLSSVIYKGVKKSEGEDLSGKTGLVKGQVITENRRRNAIEAIQKYYQEKGFRAVDVTVEPQFDKNLANSQTLTFHIVKGKKVRINEINFYGNENISDTRLKKQLKGTKEMTKFTLFPSHNEGPYGLNKPMTFGEFLNKRGYLSFTGIKEFLDPYFRFKLFSSAKFNAQKYSDDKEKVLEYYNSLGYRDAAIVADTPLPIKNGNLNVEIKVSEGRKYYFGNISWKGNTKYTDSVLTMLLGINKGDIYNIDVLNKKLGKQLSPEGGDISGLYMDDGYLFFQVNPVESAVYNDTIDFEIRMVEGPQATIKNVNISGNDKTKEHVIRRELRTVPGEKFSRADLIRSQREIANLGYFNQEKIGINPVPNPEDGTVDINYDVEEKSSDQLELSAGWGGGIGLTGTLGVSFNNFSVKNIFKREAWQPLPTGDGQKLSMRIQSNGKAYQSYNFSFTEPWLGGKKRNSFSVSLYKSIFRTGGYDQNGKFIYSDSQSLKNFGVSIALGKQLKWPDDYFTLTTALNYTQYKLNNYPAAYFGFDSGTSHNVSIKFTLNRYSLDQPIFPRSGSNFMLSAQFTPPYSLINKNITTEDSYKTPEFHKWRFTGETYIPIGKPLGADKSRQFVLKAAVKYGFMGRYNPKLDYSPFERFQVGDAGLTNNFGLLGYDIIAHRGYPVYDNSDPTVNPDQQQASQFFTIFNKYTLELRFPFSTNPSSTIYGLTFFEAANGWYNYKDYNPFRLRRSVGVGMRFFLPMFGLLGFDYGIGIDRIKPGGGLKDAARFTFMLGFEPE